MTGAVSGLAALGAVARAIETVAGLVGLSSKRKADQDQRTVGATTAENETMQDTSEIADAQAGVNSERPDVLDIARELRAEADAGERNTPRGGPAAG